jgi:hypothetical protein
MSEWVAMAAGATTIVAFLAILSHRIGRGIASLVRFNDAAFGQPADTSTGRRARPGIFAAVQQLSAGQEEIKEQLGANTAETTAIRRELAAGRLSQLGSEVRMIANALGDVAEQQEAVNATLQQVLHWQEQHDLLHGGPPSTPTVPAPPRRKG